MQFRKPTLEQLLKQYRADPQFMQNVTNWHVVPPKPARYAPYPQSVPTQLKEALIARGIEQPYIHQRQAMDAIADGQDVVIVTPTASGKTLCYNVPVLTRMMEDENARALYIFPTKALAADQVSELNEVITAAHLSVKAFTYDGDTAATARRAVRQAGNVVVTNPDMLHSGILPYHTNWVKLFENLRYVVIDELHMYRGVFGSRMANLLRRLKRICAFYGCNPQFICCSATDRKSTRLNSSH